MKMSWDGETHEIRISNIVPGFVRTRLRSEGVTVLAPARKVNGMRSAFVQAPNNMEVEIVEGHAHL